MLGMASRTTTPAVAIDPAEELALLEAEFANLHELIAHAGENGDEERLLQFEARRQTLPYLIKRARVRVLEEQLESLEPAIQAMNTRFHELLDAGKAARETAIQAEKRAKESEDAIEVAGRQLGKLYRQQRSLQDRLAELRS